MAFRVHARRLSSNGAAVLHGAYLNIGTRCVLQLPGMPNGVVAHVGDCRHVRGMIHEVDLRFATSATPAATHGGGASGRLSGTMLFVEESPVEQQFFKHYLKETDFEVMVASSLAEAKRSIGKLRPDVMMVATSIDESEIAQFAKETDEAYPDTVGPLIIASDPNHQCVRAEIARTGREPLRKPFAAEALAAYLNEHYTPYSRNRRRIEPARTDLPPELVGAYVDELHRVSRAIAEHLGARRFPELRSACLRVKGSARSFGFDEVERIASEAAATLDMVGNVIEARTEVDRLADACGSTVRPDGGAPPSAGTEAD